MRDRRGMVVMRGGSLVSLSPWIYMLHYHRGFENLGNRRTTDEDWESEL